MNAKSLSKPAAWLLVGIALPAWSAIPLAGPCDPDFGSVAACQPAKDGKNTPRNAKATAPAAGVATPPGNTGSQVGNHAPGKAALPKASSEPRQEPANPPSVVTEDGASRHQAPDAPEPLVPMNANPASRSH